MPSAPGRGSLGPWGVLSCLTRVFVCWGLSRHSLAVWFVMGWGHPISVLTSRTDWRENVLAQLSGRGWRPKVSTGQCVMEPQERLRHPGGGSVLGWEYVRVSSRNDAGVNVSTRQQADRDGARVVIPAGRGPSRGCLRSRAGGRLSRKASLEPEWSSPSRPGNGVPGRGNSQCKGLEAGRKSQGVFWEPRAPQGSRRVVAEGVRVTQVKQRWPHSGSRGGLGPDLQWRRSRWPWVESRLQGHQRESQPSRVQGCHWMWRTGQKDGLRESGQDLLMTLNCGGR